MSTLKYVKKIVRPSQVMIGGMGTWIVALLSNGPSWVNQEKVVSGIVIALSILSASIWHYGARSDVYAKKWWDPVHVRKPGLMRIVGAIGFFSSFMLAINFLPVECAVIAAFNAVAIMLYARCLDQFWPWKNIIIAGVCITPLLVGWFSGHRLNPIVPPLICATFFVYLSREILKDVMDREANHGKRFTMVMQLGVGVTLRIAGAVLLLSTLLIGIPLVEGLVAVKSSLVAFTFGEVVLVAISTMLIFGKDLSKKYQLVDIGVGATLVGLLLIRVNMY